MRSDRKGHFRLGVTAPHDEVRRFVGFSLLEVLLAVAIVGVIFVLAFALLSKAREDSKKVACGQNMRQIYVALMSYRSDHDGFLPPGRLLGTSAEEGNRSYNWSTQVKAYLPQIPRCPSMQVNATGRGHIKDTERHLSNLVGYGINYFLLRTKIEGLPGPHWTGSTPYPGHHAMAFLMEFTEAGALSDVSHLNVVLRGYDIAARRLSPRSHGKDTLNFVFLDGHMKALRRPPVPDGVTEYNAKWDPVLNTTGRDGAMIGPKRVLP